MTHKDWPTAKGTAPRSGSMQQGSVDIAENIAASSRHSIRLVDEVDQLVNRICFGRLFRRTLRFLLSRLRFARLLLLTATGLAGTVLAITSAALRATGTLSAFGVDSAHVKYLAECAHAHGLQASSCNLFDRGVVGNKDGSLPFGTSNFDYVFCVRFGRLAVEHRDLFKLFPGRCFMERASAQDCHYRDFFALCEAR